MCRRCPRSKIQTEEKAKEWNDYFKTLGWMKDGEEIKVGQFILAPSLCSYCNGEKRNV
jgi:hypothetical protein